MLVVGFPSAPAADWDTVGPGHCPLATARQQRSLGLPKPVAADWHLAAADTAAQAVVVATDSGRVGDQAHAAIPVDRGLIYQIDPIEMKTIVAAAAHPGKMDYYSMYYSMYYPLLCITISYLSIDNTHRRNIFLFSMNEPASMKLRKVSRASSYTPGRPRGSPLPYYV